MDKILRDAGRGLSDFLNGLIEKAGGLIDAGIGKIGEVTGGAVAGVSGLIESVGNVASSFTVNGPSMAVQADPVKLGRSAGFHNNDIQLASADEQFHTNVVAPVTPNLKAGQNIGAGMAA